ncbi:MAG: SAM-dependent methyltransferase [Xanthomonadales bacterium]|nr:SAM-dependent methyltransferase [Gammaproteobacteria bacterium]NNE05773.1 SAM-dependent methyltransferase [Xanthomonadales bacterium]NNL96292.1 SAM-dependent methyltransferase [Xanthomonadales bacterium]
MNAESRPVRSAQTEVHPRLEQTIRKHLAQPWRQPLHQPTVAAFKRLQRMLGRQGRSARIILDSGCGTGTSTRRTAAQCPGSLVLGVDRSIDRLGKTGHDSFPAREQNLVWLRADLPSFWVLASQAGWKLDRHLLLYPNPYPKAAHLQRRWHGHPVFPRMLSLGGELELRSNWLVYMLEFALAVELLGMVRPVIETIKQPDSASRFEAKYHDSGQALYRLVVRGQALETSRVLESIDQQS